MRESERAARVGLAVLRVSLVAGGLAVAAIAVGVPLRHGPLYARYEVALGRHVHFETWPWLLVALGGLVVSAWCVTRFWGVRADGPAR